MAVSAGPPGEALGTRATGLVSMPRRAAPSELSVTWWPGSGASGRGVGDAAPAAVLGPCRCPLPQAAAASARASAVVSVAVSGVPGRRDRAGLPRRVMLPPAAPPAPPAAGPD